MAATASTSTAVHVLEPNHEPGTGSSAEAWRPLSCAGGGEENVLDLDSPWAAVAEAGSRLEEATAAGAGLRAEEEAGQDEIRDNLQRQEDELMALEAIYGDDLVVFESKAGLRYFQIYIRYDLQDGAEVCAKFSSDNEHAKDGCCLDDSREQHQDDEPDDFSYSCSFEHLPPLVLTCVFPRSYPSKDPPHFVVTAKWMDGPNVSRLCEMLDIIWAELPGQEVVYQWVEWIRSSSLPHLGFDSKITLGPDSPTHKGDKRAISRSLSLESVIPSMFSYSSRKCHQVFLEDLHMCMICLNQTKGSNFIRLPCEHLFCVKCMETLCKMHVKEGTLFQLICPDTKCTAPIPPYLLKRLLDEEEFERWDRLTLEKALDSMSDVVHCPRCAIGCLEDEDNNAQCPKCCFVFCSLCKDSRHPGKQCLTLEEKIRQRQQATGKMSAREMVEGLMSIKELYNDARSCPKCRMTISKTEGCNKVVCISCGQAFCFLCGKAIIAGYAHFSRNCDLFAEKEKDTMDWRKRLEQLETGNRMRAQSQPVGSTVKCPKCRQKIYKGDDKYIFCWVCQATYCTMCGKQVQFTGMQSEHWGSPQCVGIKF
ncbi:hypothetical protein CFC21_031558 [Triticum aestivum]|uniref:RBR-type E3 ubiquitin transferase n=2 Tax=Triticum aestivum TaxID=4565 RepID=A0A9R1EXZ5_WHEAT|nr:E3 ubiquitin-protein ligase RNF14-like isoform X1 [Triticum aestivum]KAF7018256.1 hypothetical protein CFC21_031558 [Triticum aestivum]